MRRLAMIVATVLGLVLAGTGSAQAITWGQQDGKDHPHVVMLDFVQDGQPGKCSGTLLSPTLVLTAAHCTEGPSGEPNTSTRVTNAADLSEPSVIDWVEGQAIPHPQFTGYAEFPATYDIGLVKLEEGIDTGGVYGDLPDLGMLDALATRKGPPTQRQVTVVGYGLQGTVPTDQLDFWRHQGTTTILGVSRSANQGPHSIQLANNPGKGTGSGGTCEGDSGGPAFRIDPAGEETTIVVGITSFMMTGQCAGTNFSFRTDTAAAHDFVDEHRRT